MVVSLKLGKQARLEFHLRLLESFSPLSQLLQVPLVLLLIEMELWKLGHFDLRKL